MATTGEAVERPSGGAIKAHCQDDRRIPDLDVERQEAIFVEVHVVRASRRALRSELRVGSPHRHRAPYATTDAMA
jgi:hypothetical protein